MNFVVTDSIAVNKSIIIFLCIFCFSCVTKDNYYSKLVPESIFTEDGVICGFLKNDIIVNTPYGKMKAAAVGYISGYFFDFSYYENGNLDTIWLREEKQYYTIQCL